MVGTAAIGIGPALIVSIELIAAYVAAPCIVVATLAGTLVKALIEHLALGRGLVGHGGGVLETHRTIAIGGNVAHLDTHLARAVSVLVIQAKGGLARVAQRVVGLIRIEVARQCLLGVLTVVFIPVLTVVIVVGMDNGEALVVVGKVSRPAVDLAESTRRVDHIVNPAVSIVVYVDNTEARGRQTSIPASTLSVLEQIVFIAVALVV